MSTFITGISELRTVSELGTIKDAAMLIDDGVVTWVGPPTRRRLRRRRRRKL